MNHAFTTTAFSLDGYQVTKTLGVVRGIIVRSRSIVGSIGAGLQTLFGGNNSLYTSLCDRARSDAFELMLKHAQQLGANAVIGIRYDATEVMAVLRKFFATEQPSSLRALGLWPNGRWRSS
jgi:uncharacterized protein YbjQ (UPF0145 family)